MSETVKRRFLTWTLFRRLVIFFLILFIIAILSVGAVFAALSRDLPTIRALAEYEPPITSRVHAGDGSLIEEFAEQHRVYVPYEAIPENVVNAFIAAEDKKFFEHEGLDYVGILRGAINTARNKVTGSGGLQGGSTITQQVVKNMLLTRDQTLVRKIKEAVLARRVERAFTKQQILELYLNEIYMGYRSYGVGSAALNYFDKSLTELDLSEAAILASLAKAPSAVNPYRRPERLLARRNYVIERMLEDGYVTAEEAEAGKGLALSTVKRLRGPEYEAATYFVQELRKDLIDQYGEEGLERGGFSIRSTIDTKLQLAAKEALQNGLEAFDRRHAYRGPLTKLDLTGDYRAELAAYTLPRGHGDWEPALLTQLNADGTAKVALADGSDLLLQPEDMAWASETYARKSGEMGLRTGDVVLAEITRKPADRNSAEAQAILEAAYADMSDAEREEADALAGDVMVPSGFAVLRQVPDVEGALVALDPHTGRVLAMVGGYSYWKSAFNRAIQAKRQVGSSFKPFVYAAGLENGHTPASKVLDAPYVDFDIERNDFWVPGNYAEGQFYGMSTLRLGLEKSRNLMTVRLAQDIGMEAVQEIAIRMGIYDELPPYPAMSLGAGETTILALAEGYAALVNGGKEITPTLLDRVQDRHGTTTYRHDQRPCETCLADEWDGSEPPALEDNRRQVLDPIVAYQVSHMLEGVVERGTGRRALRVGKPLAGKTGTTNDYKDALFYGFSPDLVVGVWVGFDEPKSLGNGEAGGAVAAPIFTDFMEAALADEPALPFRIPPGVRLVEIDARTGELPGPATDDIIMEAFRPGTEPGVAFSEDEDFNIFSDGDAGLFDRMGGPPARSQPGLGNRRPPAPAQSEGDAFLEDLFGDGSGSRAGREESIGTGQQDGNRPASADEFGFATPQNREPDREPEFDPYSVETPTSQAEEMGDTW
ncbi:MAG: penicillin-binding protein 1A [Pseudomonadota bacterium]